MPRSLIDLEDACGIVIYSVLKPLIQGHPTLFDDWDFLSAKTSRLTQMILTCYRNETEGSG